MWGSGIEDVCVASAGVAGAGVAGAGVAGAGVGDAGVAGRSESTCGRGSEVRCGGSQDVPPPPPFMDDPVLISLARPPRHQSVSHVLG